MIEGMTDITVFAPTNKAFEDLKTFAAENKIILTDAIVSAVLSLHVVNGT
jgi:uncharacterized surface protein with fasciclin (FAS1) repeats